MGTTCLRQEKHDETLQQRIGSIITEETTDGSSRMSRGEEGRKDEERPMITARQSRIRETVFSPGFFVSLGDNVTARSKVAQVEYLHVHN